MLYKAVSTVNKNFEDELSELLFAYNAVSVASENSGDFSIITAVFEDIDNASDFLSNNNFTVSKMTDDDWKNKWLDDYTGGVLTPNIYITTEKESHIDGYEIILKLDPKDAFGDGKHPTTKQCSCFLESILKEEKNKDITLLDAGTGTGILAIIASYFNINNIDAVDIEEDSILSTKRNLILNNISNVNLFKSDISEFSQYKKYDIICANLLTAVIIKNIDNLIKLGKENCKYIFSGVSVQWKNEIENLFIEKKFKIIDFSELNEWCCWVVSL